MYQVTFINHYKHDVNTILYEHITVLNKKILTGKLPGFKSATQYFAHINPKQYNKINAKTILLNRKLYNLENIKERSSLFNLFPEDNSYHYDPFTDGS